MIPTYILSVIHNTIKKETTIVLMAAIETLAPSLVSATYWHTITRQVLAILTSALVELIVHKLRRVSSSHTKHKHRLAAQERAFPEHLLILSTTMLRTWFVKLLEKLGADWRWTLSIMNSNVEN